MIGCTYPTSENNKEGRDGIADPDTDPCLPPGKTDFERGGGNHPGVDVERVGNPESDEVDMAPLSSLWLDGFEIVVGKEELFVGEAWFGLAFL